MDKYILGYSDVGFSSVFSGGSWDSNLPLTLLNNPLLTARAHSTTTTATIDMTVDGEEIEVIGICKHNMTGGTYQIIGYSDSLGGTIAYDSGALPLTTPYDELFTKTIVHACDAPYSVGFWRIILTDASNPDGFIKVGRIFMGKRLHHDCNMQYGLSTVVSDGSSKIIDSDSGIETYITNPKLRGANFSMALQTISQGDTFTRLSIENGLTKAMLFELDPSNVRGGLYSFIGRSQSLSPLNFPSFQANNFNFGLVEII